MTNFIIRKNTIELLSLKLALHAMMKMNSLTFRKECGKKSMEKSKQRNLRLFMKNY